MKNKGYLLAMLCLLSVSSVAQTAVPDAEWSDNTHGASLKVKPNRCIALHRGQACYQKLFFTWETPLDHKYCLYLRGDLQPLACWQADKLKHFRHEFKASEDQQFVLRDETLNQSVSDVNVDVAWVYKKGKKVSTGWRLF